MTPQKNNRKFNIILLVADAMRADYMSCHGYPRETTPHIDGLAQEGCKFEQAISAASVTPAIFSSLFTGKFPFQHGIKEFTYTLNEKSETLARMLKKKGYYTGAITGSVVLDRSRGFSSGFDSYDDNFSEICLDPKRDLSSIESHSVIFRTADLNVNLAQNWLQNNKSDPFFLFVHFWDTHIPLVPPERFIAPEIRRYQGNINGSTKAIEMINAGDIKINAADLEYIRGLYEACVMSIDHAVGELLKYLKENGLYDNTLIVFTADHGCGLGEHQIIGNGRLIYDEDIRIPLILSAGEAFKPSRKVIPSLVSSVDILPTLLSIIGNSWEAEALAGVDLTPLMENRQDEIRNATYCETFLPMMFANKRIALRTEDWKYIREPFEFIENYQPKIKQEHFKTFIHRILKMKGHRRQILEQAIDRLFLKKRVKMHQRIETRIANHRPGLRELYHIKNDPLETVNLIAKEKSVAQAMDKQLGAWITGEAGDNTKRDLDEKLIEQLQNLGYM